MSTNLAVGTLKTIVVFVYAARQVAEVNELKSSDYEHLVARMRHSDPYKG